MKTAKLELTKSEAWLLVNLVEEHKRHGSYWGDRVKFYARQDRVLAKLIKLAAIYEKDYIP